MKNNPFSKNTNLADVESTLNTKVKNPFIEIKENEDLKKVKKKRKSILFSIDDYNKIVALSKTNGMSIVGIVNELVDASIENLNDIDRNRYDQFL
jgi:recombinational DNA repair protein RecT